MDRRIVFTGVACVTLLASCSAPPPAPVATTPEPQVVARQSQPSRIPERAAPLTLHHYKKDFAERIARSSDALFADPLPEVFKSIVVLDVTIGRDGRLEHVRVYRSNGYKALESAALDSVRQAAPFAVPVRAVQRRDGSVNFLETFLFRNDGRFQIMSLLNDG